VDLSCPLFSEAFAAKAQSFSDMQHMDLGAFVKVGDRSRKAERPMIAPGGKSIRIGGLFQKTQAVALQLAKIFKQRPRDISHSS
jgi:hypothetical protein